MAEAPGPSLATSGNRKKISRTSTTLAAMSSTDDITTLRVAARPTPSVPPVVLRPWYAPAVAMMNPKTLVLSVDGT